MKRGNQRDFVDIGKSIYEKFTKNEIQDMDMIALCEAIEKRDEQIEKYEEQIVRIKEEM